MRRLLFIYMLTSSLSYSPTAVTEVASENLLDIYELAVKHDPTMRAARAELRSQEEIKRIGLANLLPQINLQASYTEVEDNNESNNSSNTTNSSVNNAVVLSNTKTDTRSIGLSLTQNILNMNAWYAYKSSQYNTEYGEITFAKNQQALLTRTVSSYLSVLSAKNNLTSSHAEELAIKQQLDQTKQRYDVGLVALTDVQEAQAAFDLARVRHLNNEGNLQIAYENLSLLTAKSHSSIGSFSKNLPIAPPNPSSIEEWVNIATQENYDIKLANSNETAAKYAARSARSSHLPSLQLVAGYTKSNRQGESFGVTNQDIDNTNESIALQLSLPLYNGGSLHAGRRQARANYDIAIENHEGIVRTTTQQTRASYIALTTHIQKVAAYKQTINSTESALQAIQAGYDVGTRNIVDVLNAQRNVFSAERDYANSKYDYINSYFNLKAMAGILTPADIHSLNEWITTHSPLQ